MLPVSSKHLQRSKRFRLQQQQSGRSNFQEVQGKLKKEDTRRIKMLPQSKRKVGKHCEAPPDRPPKQLRISKLHPPSNVLGLLRISRLLLHNLFQTSYEFLDGRFCVLSTSTETIPELARSKETPSQQGLKGTHSRPSSVNSQLVVNSNSATAAWSALFVRPSFHRRNKKSSKKEDHKAFFTDPPQ